MFALKCDRCGKLYEAEENYQGQGYKYKLTRVGMLYDKVDLCSDCMSALQRWMEQEAPSGNNEPGVTVKFTGGACEERTAKAK